MKLITETLERVLEMKLIEKRSDTIEGNFVVTETLKNEYTAKGMKIKSQHTAKEIKNLSEEKVLQEISCDTEYKLNRNGDIVGSKFICERGEGEVETLNYYDSKKRIISTLTKTMMVYDGVSVPCTIRERFSYDEQGRIFIYTSDTLHDDKNKDKDVYLYFIFSYEDDCNLLKEINILRTIPSNHDHQIERHIVNYTNTGYIESIHNIDYGDDQKCDEYFEYYSDNSVHVMRCVFDEDGTVIGKVMGMYKQIV